MGFSFLFSLCATLTWLKQMKGNTFSKALHLSKGLRGQQLAYSYRVTDLYIYVHISAYMYSISLCIVQLFSPIHGFLDRSTSNLVITDWGPICIIQNAEQMYSTAVALRCAHVWNFHMFLSCDMKYINSRLISSFKKNLNWPLSIILDHAFLASLNQRD